MADDHRNVASLELIQPLQLTYFAVHGAHGFVWVAVALQKLAIELPLSFRFGLAFFLGFPGGNFLFGGFRIDRFNYPTVLAENVVAPSGCFLGDGTANDNLAVFIGITIHPCLYDRGRHQRSRSRYSD
ncbi:hypothetical protein AU15_03620 [Marinobacter salarius]|uniref:Uncharacterized protein n=1 Tax=Marinobacter salarius TaxID=1420917 RepID=W5Z3D1_9GAMM|nr:hypothetical protein AU15_03620 [Marinobacter salarius]